MNDTEQPEQEVEPKKDVPVKTMVTVGQRGVAIRSLEELYRFATMVQKSGLAPRSFRRAEEICVAVAHGLELGLSPMQALQGLTVIEGRVGLYTQTARALVEAHPECEYVIDDFHELSGVTTWTDDMGVTSRVKRKGKPEVVRAFTVGEAKQAALWGKVGKYGPSAWVTYPGRMLYNRSMGFGLGDAFPDVLKGLRTAEELWDYPPEGPKSGDTVAPKSLEDLAEDLEQEAMVTVEKKELRRLQEAARDLEEEYGQQEATTETQEGAKDE